MTMFAPTSFWNQRLPANAPIDPNSAAIMVKTLAMLEAHPPALNYKEYACPIYTASPTDPIVSFTLDAPVTAANEDLAKIMAKVPMPSNARPAGPFPGDNHMVIHHPGYNPTLEASDIYFEFWRALQFEIDGAHSESQAPGVSTGVLTKPGWHFQAGCAIQNVGKNLGFFNDESWPGITGRKFGAAASKLPFGGSVIRAAEAQRRLIPHAIAFSGIKSEVGTEPRYPAQRADGESVVANAPQEGMLFRLPPSFSLSSIKDAFMRSIAQAWRDYGTYIHDNSNSACAIKLEQQSLVRGSQERTTDPWLGPTGVAGGEGAIFTGIATTLAKELPWSSLEVVAESYRPATTVPGGLRTK